MKEDQDKMAKIEDILDQEKDVNSDLKKQYDELTQAKADLETKLQTVLQEKAAAVAALQAQAQAQQPVSCSSSTTGCTTSSCGALTFKYFWALTMGDEYPPFYLWIKYGQRSTTPSCSYYHGWQWPLGQSPRDEPHPRTLEGVKRVEEIIKAARDNGIKFLTIYAFSTENWSRPQDEVSMIMRTFIMVLGQKAKELREQWCSYQFYRPPSGSTAGSIKSHG